MKKSFVLTFIVCLSALSYGQITHPRDGSKTEFNNVVGVDATGLLQQFLSLNQYGGYYYVPYIATYKRIIKSNAIRFGLGGSISNSSTTEQDTSNLERNRNTFNVGIGFEHYTYINKKCNLYFGIDAIYQYSYNEYHSWSPAYNYNSEDKTHGYGVSPVLGFQLRYWNRISFAVETSYEILYSTNKSTDDRKYPEYPETQEKSDGTGISTRFVPPVMIRFQVHL